MADDFKTTDRASADIDLAAKETSPGKLTPRSILTAADGVTDIDPATAGKQDTANTSLAALELALADSATETTLAAVKTAAEAIAVDPPTETTLAAVKTATEAIAVDPPTETTLAAMSAKLPAALGSAADSASLAVTQSTEDKAAIGALTETAPATDTASSGLNGRLQRIAQRITSLIALLPSSPGAKAGSGSLSVVEALPTTTNISVQTSATGSSFVAFASAACQVVRIVNAWPGASDIEVRRGGSGDTIPVPGGAERAFDGVTNASDLQVRRIDQSNTQQTIYCEAVVL